MKKAVFSGSFDPITKGHEDIILRALPLFDEIIVAIGVNIMKKNAFSLEQRLQWIKDTFADYPKVKVAHYEGLTVDFCKENDAMSNSSSVVYAEAWILNTKAPSLKQTKK